MSTEPQRTCPTCGNELSGAMEFCPVVCVLRVGLAGGAETAESSSEDTLNPTSQDGAYRFEHYELVTGEDGKPVELGRGAMGVTYKAFDIDLRCPVTLKVPSAFFEPNNVAFGSSLRHKNHDAAGSHQVGISGNCNLCARVRNVTRRQERSIERAIPTSSGNRWQLKI
jgi:hypothetical protein